MLAPEEVDKALAKHPLTHAMASMLHDIAISPANRVARQYYNPSTCDALIRRKLIKKFKMPREFSSVWYTLTPLGLHAWARATGNQIH